MRPYEPIYTGPTGPFYSDEFFAELADEIGLTNDEIVILKDGLEDAALAWHKSRLTVEAEPNMQAFSGDLEELYRHTKSTAETLRAMPNEAWQVLGNVYDFWHEYDNVPTVSFRDYDEFGNGGHTIVDGNVLGSATETLRLSPEELAQFLENLSRLAELPKAIFQRRRGPRPNYLLIDWLSRVAGLWSHKMNRPFVRGYITRGISHSDAAILCRSAYRELDPDTSQSRIENEMKKLIGRSRGKIV